MMTIARETSMAIHSRADRWGSRVPKDEGGHIRERCEPFHAIINDVATSLKKEICIRFTMSTRG